MGVDHQAHRSGVLKQTNKGHKTGRHRSKGAIDNEQKGMVRRADRKLFDEWIKRQNSNAN